MTEDELRENVVCVARMLTVLALTSRAMAEALASYRAATKGLRRTAGGMWTVEGRRYRSKALALVSVLDRAEVPYWPVLLERRR